MDQPQYTTLVEVLQAISDPRHARGLRHPWLLLLTLIALAVASGQRTAHAIADWVAQHAEEVRTQLQLSVQAFPSESTFRRALRAIPAETLESLIARFTPTLAVPVAPTASAPPPALPVWQGQAVDGKEVRGVARHGPALWLVSLVQHGSGIVLMETAVDQKSNEITAVPRLLTGRDLTGTVTTMDALLTQRRVAQHILDQHGHYLMVVKANQPELYQAIALLFAQPPWTRIEQKTEYDRCQTVGKGHGRLERRVLESSSALQAYLDWPGVQQVMRRTCQRISRKTGQVREETTYGLTSLSPKVASASVLEQLWREHWTIENRVHYVRDVTMGEDAGQLHTGSAPQVLAALRNAILSLYRSRGWQNIADAIRHYDAAVARAAELIGLRPARL